MPDGFRIVGCSRTELSDEEFRSLARSAVERVRAHAPGWRALGAVRERSSPMSAPPTASIGWRKPSPTRSARSAAGRGCCTTCRCHRPRRPAVVTELRTTGLNADARVIMEKPFGTDLASARALNATLLTAFDESQIFRIDHFLGKEAVQNILALRFANGLFEPVWNRNHIDHVQIDVPETLSIGTRAAFYEGTGAYRDMVVTHLFQVLGFVAMEPPTSLEREDPRRREDQGLRRDAAASTCGRGAGPVRGLPRRGGCAARFGDRDVRRGAGPGGQLALGRGSLLPADREASRREPAGS